MNPTVNMLSARLRRACERGVAAIEFALTLPLWITLLLGVGDGTYFLLINEKLDRISYTLTDIVTQYQTITLSNLNDISLAAEQLLHPFSFSDGAGQVVITSVYQGASGAPVVKWQYKYPTTGTHNSALGTTGGTAALPHGLVLNANDNVIVTEVFYNFTPMFTGSFLAQTLYRTAVYKPRLSPLVTPPT